MKKRYLLVPLLISSLVACNGGGGSGGYTPPTPPPTNYCTQDGIPTYQRSATYSISEQVQYNNNRYLKISTINGVTPDQYPGVWQLLGSCNQPYNPPAQLQPLNLSSIGTPLNLNKVGGNDVWYMLVNNPNSETVILNTISDNTNQIFAEAGYQNYDSSIIHPTQFVESYNGEVSGYSNTPDCLSLIEIGSNLKLTKNQSCIYKFRAFWNSNLDMPTTTNFKLDYTFYSESNGSPTNYYCTTGVESCPHVIPYDSHNTLSYQSYNLKSQDNVVTQMGFANFNFSYNGNKVLNWTQQTSDNTTQYVSTYNVNYNASTNQVSLSGNQQFSGWNTSHGSYNFTYPSNGFISANGSNFGANFWSNYTFVNWLLNPTVGTSGSVYAQNTSLATAYKSTIGDFSNPANYTQLPYSWFGADMLIGFDETNNIAVLYRPSNGQNYCFNVNNGTYMDMTLSSSNSSKYIYQSVGTGQQFITNLNTINGELYGYTFGLYVQGQNGQYSIYSADNTAFLRKFDTINCTISSNSKIYSFSGLSGNSPVGGYTVINPSISNNYILSNSNLY